MAHSRPILKQPLPCWTARCRKASRWSRRQVQLIWFHMKCLVKYGTLCKLLNIVYMVKYNVVCKLIMRGCTLDLCFVCCWIRLFSSWKDSAAKLQDTTSSVSNWRHWMLQRRNCTWIFIYLLIFKLNCWILLGYSCSKSLTVCAATFHCNTSTAFWGERLPPGGSGAVYASTVNRWWRIREQRISS